MDRRSSPGLRFSFGELPLLKSMAARKLSTCQAQSALEKGVLQLLKEQNTTDAMPSSSLSSPSSYQPKSPVPTSDRHDTPLFAALSSWSFSSGECSTQSASKQKTLDACVYKNHRCSHSDNTHADTFMATILFPSTTVSLPLLQCLLRRHLRRGPTSLIAAKAA